LAHDSPSFPAQTLNSPLQILDECKSNLELMVELLLFLFTKFSRADMYQIGNVNNAEGWLL
jgi:hypothetical protein